MKRFRALQSALLTASLGVLVYSAAPVCLAQAATPASAEPAPHGAYVKPIIKHEPYGDVRLVVPLTSDDKAIQGMKLRNILNGFKSVDEWGGKFTVKVVLYAKGLTLLKSPDDATMKKLDALRARGVQFVVCGNSLSEQDVDFHTMYHVTDDDIVPSGFAEVAYLQVREHYAVDPVN